jgi:hypothetical protein
LDVGDFHGDLKEMPLGMGERDFVADDSVRRGGQEKTKKEHGENAKSRRGKEKNRTGRGKNRRTRGLALRYRSGRRQQAAFAGWPV